MSAFKSKLESFQNRFKSLLGAKAQGYDELNTLERPLVSDLHEQEDYERQHGVPATAGYRPAPTAGHYQPPAAAGVYGAPPPAAGLPGGLPLPLPSQADELQELCVLARDAAEILWEMVALGEGGAVADDMKSKARQLQAQLRGAIGDYQGGEESVYAKAFESLDMLNACLDDQPAPAATGAVGMPPAATAAAAAVPAGSAAPAVASKPPADEAPLISFD